MLIICIAIIVIHNEKQEKNPLCQTEINLSLSLYIYYTMLYINVFISVCVCVCGASVPCYTNFESSTLFYLSLPV